jgi:hypothetical protein
MERIKRVELLSTGWKPVILAIVRYSLNGYSPFIQPRGQPKGNIINPSTFDLGFDLTLPFILYNFNIIKNFDGRTLKL